MWPPPIASQLQRASISVASLTLLFISCNTVKSQKTSTTKGGQIVNSPYANLLNLRPHQSVEICSSNPNHAPFATRAIQTWASQINRWNYIKVNPCGSRSDLVIYMYDANIPGMNNYLSNPGQIQVMATYDMNMLYALTLHEIGHSWGLCDQYPTVNNCIEHFGGIKDDNEVMGTTNPTKHLLRQGDINAIKNMAAKNIPVNLEWNAFLADPKNQINHPSTPPDPAKPNTNNSNAACLCTKIKLTSGGVACGLTKQTQLLYNQYFVPQDNICSGSFCSKNYPTTTARECGGKVQEDPNNLPPRSSDVARNNHEQPDPNTSTREDPSPLSSFRADRIPVIDSFVNPVALTLTEDKDWELKIFSIREHPEGAEP